MRSHWEEHQQTRTFRQSENRRGHFIYGVFLDLTAALDAVGNANAREEQPQIVIDLCNRRYG